MKTKTTTKIQYEIIKMMMSLLGLETAVAAKAMTTMKQQAEVCIGRCCCCFR
jgi:hypothetical protein